MSEQFDLEQTVQRPVYELFDAFDGDDSPDQDLLVAGDADGLADGDGLAEFDLAGVVTFDGAQQVAEPHVLVEAIVPPLTGAEVEHYWWLIGGLIDGGMRLVSSAYPASHALDALDCARELLDELMARVVPVEDAR